MSDEKLYTLCYEQNGKTIELGKFNREEVEKIAAYIQERQKESGITPVDIPWDELEAEDTK